jgi:hypothetical protein
LHGPLKGLHVFDVLLGLAVLLQRDEVGLAVLAVSMGFRRLKMINKELTLNF